jgi:hypothetical protein
VSAKILDVLPGTFGVANPLTGWATAVWFDGRGDAAQVVSLVAADLDTLRAAVHRLSPRVDFDCTSCDPVIVAGHRQTAAGDIDGEPLGPREPWPLARWFQAEGRDQLAPQFGRED